MFAKSCLYRICICDRGGYTLEMRHRRCRASLSAPSAMLGTFGASFLAYTVYPPLFLAIHHWTPCNLSVLLFGNISIKSRITAGSIIIYFRRACRLNFFQIFTCFCCGWGVYMWTFSAVMYNVATYCIQCFEVKVVNVLKLRLFFCERSSISILLASM